ncbi:hypothetical protein [Lacinutrix chionoecetis]
MKKQRKQLVAWLFQVTQKIYTKYFKKNEPWNLTKSHLLNFPKQSFGYHIGMFLKQNHFEIIPKAERHDAYHTITGYHTKEQDEIALQYLCYGNGKRSPYLYGVIIIGTLILPEYVKYYYNSYSLGKTMNPFYNLDFKSLLHTPFSTITHNIFNN